MAAALALALVPPAAAQVQPYQANDYKGFHSVLPPGTHGTFNAVEFAQFQLSGTYPPHARDQVPLYENLVYATPGLTAGQIPSYFKDGSFGVQAGQVERTYSPRAGVTVQRDSGYGVPHVYGLTRSDTIFGAGYVSAEDRLFFMDVLRHAGRGQLSGFAGGANKAMDADVWANAPYTEADLQEQIDLADDFYGAQGAALQQDLVDYVAGINQYISEARSDPTKMPYEYAAIGKPLEDWQGTDVIATAALIGGIFGKGGGGELGSAVALEEARDRFGGAAGEQAWRDFRRQDDPEAPTTVKSGNGSFPYPTERGSAGVALPDEGSLVDPPNNSSTPLVPGAEPLFEGLRQLGGFSNALLVSGAESESGRPVAVMGPQVAYFMPEILLELDLHGPDLDAQGAAFAGVSPYVLLGRGQDFAWSATSAGQDIIDTFAEKLCEPDGSEPDVQSTHYLYKGECREMETLTRVNNITPNPGDPSPPETFTLQAQRTVHGIVAKRGTVDGQPVAFARQRSTYFHEADSARAFADLNRPSKVQNVEDFQRVVSDINFTFNWFYADNRDIGYFNSGDNPVRAEGADPDLPNWGTGEYDWQGWETHFKSADYTPFEEHPQVINQDYITSWNNKQAPEFDSADGQWGYGPIYRSDSLDEEIDPRIAGAGKMSLPEAIDSMEEAGTVDLRGKQTLPLLLQVVGTPSNPQLASAVSTLQAWLAAGAHRIDRDQSGQYEHSSAIQIMDAWWPRLLEAEFEPEMGSAFFDAVHSVLAFDNEPNNHGQHLGSAYQDGWWGYVSKDLRRVLGQSAADPFSRTYCGNGSLTACRDALRQALADAIGVPATELYDEDSGTAGVQRVSGCPAGKSDQWCFDSVRFRPIGAVTVPTIHWINRPTYQQAVEVQGHRPRGYVRTKSASPVEISLVPAFKACAAPNRQHGPPLAFGSCNPPEQRSSYLTVGAPDANGRVANSTGSVTLRVVPGNPLTPADEADVNLRLALTDVRKQSDLSDYTGQLQIESVVRITDRDNDEGAGGGSDPATVSDFPLDAPATCTATPDTTIGGTCNLVTTLDAVVPGVIGEGDRASWELGALQVFDGGADGLLSTAPNTLFARQGVFVP
ncbi:MAG TPA: penicillin acylase family protein [Solirubrobacterales bacterium]|nr:penicillin acylase family protein [Solirubrobacterales bacterium]